MYPLVSISRLGQTPEMYIAQQNSITGDTVACLCVGLHVMHTVSTMDTAQIDDLGQHLSTHRVIKR